jgi:hypothetical protein
MNAFAVNLVLSGLGFAAVLCLIFGLLKHFAFVPSRLREVAALIISPILHCVAFITPRFIPPYLHSLIAAFWFWVFRVGFYVALIFGFLPAATPS